MMEKDNDIQYAGNDVMMQIMNPIAGKNIKDNRGK